MPSAFTTTRRFGMPYGKKSGGKSNKPKACYRGNGGVKVTGGGSAGPIHGAKGGDGAGNSVKSGSQIGRITK